MQVARTLGGPALPPQALTMEKFGRGWTILTGYGRRPSSFIDREVPGRQSYGEAACRAVLPQGFHGSAAMPRPPHHGDNVADVYSGRSFAVTRTNSFATATAAFWARASCNRPAASKAASAWGSTHCAGMT